MHKSNFELLVRAFRAVVFVSLCIIITFSSLAQSFTNGDLNGTVGFSTNPTGWQRVPHNYVNSLATGVPQSTPDICSVTGPSASFGMVGIPHSGSTFASGLDAASGSSYWQEGIQQSISGFVVGCEYTVSFWQAVVKYGSSLDSSGSWMMCVDNTVVGTSAVSTSALAHTDVNLQWELRSISFIPTSTSHIIRFLVKDDDSNHLLWTVGGALAMGIDLISVTQTCGLPVELINFQALANNDNTTDLSWQTASERDNDYFEVQRSVDGINFKSILKVNGAGNSTQLVAYSVRDEQPLRGISYYRLKQVDFDGTETYSEIRSATFEGLELVNYHPNPVENELYLHVLSEREAAVSIDIYDALGRKIQSQEFDLISGNESLQINISTLESGVYRFVLKLSEAYFITKEFIKS